MTAKRTDPWGQPLCECAEYIESDEAGDTCQCGHLLGIHDFFDRFGPDPRECECKGI